MIVPLKVVFRPSASDGEPRAAEADVAAPSIEPREVPPKDALPTT